MACCSSFPFTGDVPHGLLLFISLPTPVFLCIATCDDHSTFNCQHDMGGGEAHTSFLTFPLPSPSLFVAEARSGQILEGFARQALS